MEWNATNSRSKPRSNRFLRPEDAAPRPLGTRAWGSLDVFVEGPWLQIRVSLERQGWNHSQIERIHDHLRHGWPLRLAQHNVAAISGHCPLRSGRQT